MIFSNVVHFLHPPWMTTILLFVFFVFTFKSHSFIRNELSSPHALSLLYDVNGIEFEVNLQSRALFIVDLCQVARIYTHSQTLVGASVSPTKKKCNYADITSFNKLTAIALESFGINCKFRKIRFCLSIYSQLRKSFYAVLSKNALLFTSSL